MLFTILKQALHMLFLCSVGAEVVWTIFPWQTKVLLIIVTLMFIFSIVGLLKDLLSFIIRLLLEDKG